MGIKSKIATFTRVAMRVLLGFVLLVIGLVVGLYSPWVQDSLSKAAIEYVNSKGNGTVVSFERLRLRFPLKLHIGGLSIVNREGGDTIINAGMLYADVSLPSLLNGKVSVKRATLVDGLYVMGTPDSAMYLKARIGKLDLEPALVDLTAPMTIDLENATIADTKVSINIKPDTSAPADTAKSESSPLIFKAGKLHLVNFDYSMSLAPGIDSIGAGFGDATISDAIVDLGEQKVDIAYISGNGLNAAYIASGAIAGSDTVNTTIQQADSTASAPWTVKVHLIDFDGGSALYTTAGHEPQPGMDFGYIMASRLRLRISEFYNQASNITLPIDTLRAEERCGLSIDAGGTLRIDSAGMHIEDFRLETPEGTDLSLSGLMGMGDMANDGNLPLRLNLSGNISTPDIASMFPAAQVIASGLPDGAPIELKIDAEGTTSRLEIETLEADINRCIELSADGSILWPMNPERMAGSIKLNGRIYNITPLKNKLFDRALAKMFNIPPMEISGKVDMSGSNIDGRINVLTSGGRLAADGAWISRTEGYRATLTLKDFPLDAFLPSYGIGRVTATASANGQGLDPLSAKTSAQVDISLVSAEYAGYTYRDLAAAVSLSDGTADIKLDSTDPDMRFGFRANGNLSPAPYAWSGSLAVDRIDLKAIRMSESPLSLTGKIDFSADISPADSTLRAIVSSPNIAMTDSAGTVNTENLKLSLDASPHMTAAHLDNEDLHLILTSACPVDSLGTRISAAADSLLAGLQNHKLDISSIQKSLPDFTLTLNAGRDNAAARYMALSKISFDSLQAHFKNDSILAFSAGVNRFAAGETTIDTITFAARQDSSMLLFRGDIGNRPGTFDNFAKVKLRGHVSPERIQMMVNQENIHGKTGFNIGASAHYADSTIRVSFIPGNPIIGYKLWSINPDNYISYNIPRHHIDANLHLMNADSQVELYTIHDEQDEHDGHDEYAQEDVVLKVNNLRLSDWLSFNPFAPPIKGIASADMRVRWNSGSLNGSGTLGVDSLYYGKERVGDFLADVDLSTNKSGLIKASAGLTVDGVRTIDINGSLNDTTKVSPFNLDFSMIHFPLTTINPFLPAGTVKLRGMLNGKMDITGDISNPRFAGKLDFDSTAVKVVMLGTDFVFSENPIDVQDNIVSFKDFTIKGTNANPLRVNGTADITNLSNIAFALNMKATDMGLVNSSRAAKGADVYGKAYIDLDADVKGNMSFVNVNASLSLLGGTNVFYNIPDATNTIQSMKNDQMVRFVQFSDTTTFVAEEPETSSMAMNIDAVLTLEAGSSITVNLSSNGTDKLQIQPEGTLNYTQPPLSDGRMTGRLNLNKGFVRYSLPVLGEKSFDLQQGCYVNFTGPLLNPSLNISAVDEIRANVTQEGQNSRLINFDVLLKVSGTLETMNVAFDLSTDDDLTIANELQSMTQEQRANQAMNLLLYGTYSGGGAKANANLSGNALYGFLEGQLNSWAAKNIRGVDLSFGIDQYDKTYDGNTSTATQYSYKVSKSLFNDRVKVIVGGNYSTDANNDENFSQNLINDISFEYLLNRQGTMLLRLFRHTGYESILEGEVTQTGVGFVYRRKIRRLIDMFRPFSKTSAAHNREPQTDGTTDDASKIKEEKE